MQTPSYSIPPQAVITGGHGALARAIASVFRQAGWQVHAPGRNELDVTDVSAIDRYFQDREVELLVCAAGMIHDRPLARLSETEWDKIYHVNFTGAALCAHAALPAMAARGTGHLIFISSHSAHHPPAGQAPYAAAKAALLGLTRDLAITHGPAGIRVNAILPGFLESPMTSAMSATRTREIRNAHALGNFNTADHAAAFILHLHQHLTRTSGQVFQLDSRPAP